MAEKQQQQQATPEHPSGGLRRLLQRGHSGEGAHSVLELIRRRRDFESQQQHGSPRPQPPDPGADRDR